METSDLKFEVVKQPNALQRLFKNQPVSLRSIPKDKDTISQEKVARGILHTLLYKLGIEASISSISEEDGNMHITLESEQSAHLIGKYGRTLDSLQFLLNLLTSKWIKDRQRIALDVCGYRKKRKKSIEELCIKIANKVAKNHKSTTLNHMNPYERRIVHLFLEDDDRVYTESLGSGVYKRVCIYPEGKAKEDTKKEYYDDPNFQKNEDDDENEYDQRQPDFPSDDEDYERNE